MSIKQTLFIDGYIIRNKKFLNWSTKIFQLIANHWQQSLPQFPLSPEVLSLELPPQPVSVNSSITPLKEDLLRSCVTPRKVQRVRATLQSEKDRCKCAIKLLPDFFTEDELAVSNTEGNFGKQPLDKTKLHTLKGMYVTQERGTYI